MARGKASFGLTGLLVVFGAIVVVGMLFFSRSSISGFQDIGECVLGLKPCDEGYFCNSGKCSPVFPAPTNKPSGYRQGVDLS